VDIHYCYQGRIRPGPGLVVYKGQKLTPKAEIGGKVLGEGHRWSEMVLCLHNCLKSNYRYLLIGIRAWGLGTAAPQSRAKAIILGQKLSFRAEASSQNEK